jgi:predicted XRE-type DNA-binding protein
MNPKNNPAIGGTWADYRDTHFSSEEIAASDLRVALIGEMIQAREAGKLSQRKLEELSGVRQPIISRLERQIASPNLDTVLKLLGAMGKTLRIVDVEPQRQSCAEPVNSHQSP